MKPDSLFTAEDFWKEFTTLDMIDRGWATLLADFANAKLAPLLEELASAKARLAPLTAENERLKDANKHLQVSLDRIEAAEKHHHALLWKIHCAANRDMSEELREVREYFDSCEDGKSTVCKLTEQTRIMKDALTDVRSELTHDESNQDTDWCIEHICEALARVIEHRDRIVLKAREALAAVKKLEEK